MLFLNDVFTPLRRTSGQFLLWKRTILSLRKDEESRKYKRILELFHRITGPAGISRSHNYCGGAFN